MIGQNLKSNTKVKAAGAEIRNRKIKTKDLDMNTEEPGHIQVISYSLVSHW